MKFLYSFLLGLALSLTALQASAIPAQRGAFTRLQPDGTRISLMLHGDEHGHYMTDTSGNVVVESSDGYVRYARPDASGLTVASEFIVTPNLSADCREFLARVDRQGMIASVMKNRDARIAVAPSRAAGERFGLMGGSDFPLKGNPRTLVIIVEYSNVGFRIHDPADFFNRMLNADTFTDKGATGSAHEWFLENSSGQFAPQFDVYGPIKLPHTQSYYGGNNQYNNDANPTAMVIDACKQLDYLIDFSEYDLDDDGKIDNVYIFFAGLSEAQGGGADCVWPHQWSVYDDAGQKVVLDGVILNHYAVSNEWQPLEHIDEGGPAGMGTFCHEFGHVLGLPDLYATNYTGAITLGDWDVMDHGSYNNDGYTPPLYSAYERYALGWIEPRELNGDANVTLRDISGNTACIVKTPKDTELFLLENRQPEGWNSYIPGHGMLLWHIDYVPIIFDKNSVNNNRTHQYVDLIEADGSWDDATRRNAHCFPGTAGITSITDDGVASMKMWDGTSLNMPITEIAENNGIITFKVGNGASPLPAVTGLKVGEINPYNATISWNGVNGATLYRVSVALKGEDKPLLNFRELAVHDTRIKLEGLTPEKKYTVTVRAESPAAEGPETSLNFESGMLTFDYRTPVIGEATDITSEGFTANWEPMSNADNYLLTIYTAGLGNESVDAKSFDEGLSELTRGWSVNTARMFETAENSGQAPPSLRFSGSGWILNTPSYAYDVVSFSMWYKGVDVSEGATLSVEYQINGEWTAGPVLDVTNSARSWDAEVPAGTRSVQLKFKRESGELALDDIVVKWGAQVVHTPVDGLIDINVGNVTSYEVRNLKAETDYAFSVKGVSAGVVSLPSDIVGFTTSESSIKTVGTDVNKAATVYYDLQGRVVTRPESGFYIRVTGGKASKVMIP